MKLSFLWREGLGKRKLHRTIFQAGCRVLLSLGNRWTKYKEEFLTFRHYSIDDILLKNLATYKRISAKIAPRKNGGKP